MKVEGDSLAERGLVETMKTLRTKKRMIPRMKSREPQGLSGLVEEMMTQTTLVKEAKTIMTMRKKWWRLITMAKKSWNIKRMLLVRLQ